MPKKKVITVAVVAVLRDIQMGVRSVILGRDEQPFARTINNKDKFTVSLPQYEKCASLYLRLEGFYLGVLPLPIVRSRKTVIEFLLASQRVVPKGIPQAYGGSPHCPKGYRYAYSD